jgi:hypothetical protein
MRAKRNAAESTSIAAERMLNLCQRFDFISGSKNKSNCP